MAKDNKKKKTDTGNITIEDEQTEKTGAEDKTAEDSGTGKDPEVKAEKDPETTEKNPKTEGAEKEASVDQKETKAEDDKAKDAGSSDSFFKKKEKKDPKDEKIAELTDRLQRQMAEFDNFRKRTEKEKASMYDMGVGDTAAKILDVVDNFERGLKGADEKDPFVEGMNKIYKQLVKVLTDIGVTPIEAEGKEFDPNLHNAVMHEENPDAGENVVTAELQKGYKYKDSVIRHSMVKVAN